MAFRGVISSPAPVELGRISLPSLLRPPCAGYAAADTAVGDRCDLTSSASDSHLRSTSTKSAFSAGVRAVSTKRLASRARRSHSCIFACVVRSDIRVPRWSAAQRDCVRPAPITLTGSAKPAGERETLPPVPQARYFWTNGTGPVRRYRRLESWPLSSRTRPLRRRIKRASGQRRHAA